MLNPIGLLLVFVLAAAGYLVIAQSVCQNARSQSMVPALAIVTLFLYLCGASFVALLYIYFGYDTLVLFAAMILFAIIALALVIRNCIRYSEEMNTLYVVFFLAYCALVVFATLYSRVGSWQTGIQMTPFLRVSEAVQMGDYELMGHDALNIAMFVPLGLLIPLMNRRVFDKLSYAVLFGMIASTTIETVQMLTHLGMFDIDDIIANVLGAVIGYVLCSLYLKMVGRSARYGRY